MEGVKAKGLIVTGNTKLLAGYLVIYNIWLSSGW
jgi:hypothetical protein